MNKGIM